MYQPFGLQYKRNHKIRNHTCAFTSHRQAEKYSYKRINHFSTMHLRHFFAVSAYSERPYERLNRY